MQDALAAHVQQRSSAWLRSRSDAERLASRSTATELRRTLVLPVDRVRRLSGVSPEASPNWPGTLSRASVAAPPALSDRRSGSGR